MFISMSLNICQIEKRWNWSCRY